MAVYVKRKNKIEEEDTNVNSTAATASKDEQRDAKLQQLNAAIVQKKEQKRTIKTEYENKTRVIDQQINQLDKEVASLGGAVDSTSESLRRRFGKTLYESLTDTTGELAALIYLTFDNEEISGTPDKKRCYTYAREMINFINKEIKDKDLDEESTRDLLMGWLSKKLKASQNSFSDREIRRFSESLMKNMKESAVFSWMFSEKN